MTWPGAKPTGNGKKMIQYLLTGLAGLALGIVAMRVWQAREPESGSPGAVPARVAPAEATSVQTGRTSGKLLLGAGAIAAAAVGIIAWRSVSAPDGGATLTATAAVGPTKALDDVDTMISRLAARLEKNPNDGEGFRMLGWSYVMTSRPDLAIAPYKRALALMPQSALVHSGYGEALVGVAKQTVTPEAKAQFDRAIALDPTEPRSRYFLALWQAQHGEERQALEKWVALANSGPADANWQTDLRRQIGETSAKLGIDVSARLKPSAPMAAAPPVDSSAAQVISALPPAQQQASINQMVDGLAAKLKADPANAGRWVMLLRSRMVLKQGEQAGADLVTARRALANDKSGLASVDAAARELGIPGAK